MKQIFKDRFKDRVMILTGAARGIGEATAIRAAKEGAKLVLVDRLEKEGNQVLEVIKKDGGEAIFLHLDLSYEESAKEMVSKAIESYGHLEIAINNAGVMGSPSPLHELKREQMDYTMMNNFYSVFFSCKYELLEFMKEDHGGVIVNNASIAGLTGLPGNPAYVASKHAINGLTKNLALDYNKYGVRINSVNPAGTSTPMVEEAYQYVKEHMEAAIKAGMDPKQAQTMAGQKRTSILEREATAEEQAASILFLVSDDSTHMTGATVQTDGGWTSF